MMSPYPGINDALERARSYYQAGDRMLASGRLLEGCDSYDHGVQYMEFQERCNMLPNQESDEWNLVKMFLWFKRTICSVELGAPNKWAFPHWEIGVRCCIAREKMDTDVYCEAQHLFRNGQHHGALRLLYQSFRCPTGDHLYDKEIDEVIARLPMLAPESASGQ